MNENRLTNSFLNNSKNSDHDHDDVSSWSFVSEREVDEAKFKKWIAMLYSLRPYAVLRMKCVVKFRKFDKPFLIQAVGNTVSDFEPLENWPKDKIQTRIVIIFKGLEERAINASFSRWVVND